MARNSIGSKRGSVRGAPPSVYVPFGTYDPDTQKIREAIKFFGDWLKIAVAFILLIFFLVVLVAFTGNE